MLDIKNIKTPQMGDGKKPFPFVKALPSWFNLENYHKASQLDIEGWITQIWFRQMIEGYFFSFVLTGVIDDFCIPEPKNIDETPASVKPISTFDAVLMIEALKNRVQIPSDIWQAPSIFSNNWLQKKKGLIAWFKEHTNTKERNKPLANIESPRIFDAFIHVDLNASDAVLLDSFKKWLQIRRGAAGRYRGRSFSVAILHRWALNQVLPYIDLTYWAKLTEVQIPHWLMGEALFPGYNQGDKADRVRKTTEKTAKEVMLTACLHSMTAQLKYQTGKSLDLDIFFTDPNQVETKNKIFIPPKK